MGATNCRMGCQYSKKTKLEKGDGYVIGTPSKGGGDRNSVDDTQELEDLQKELGDYLTNEEINIVKTSWEIISQDLHGAGLYMFQRLFEQQAMLKKLFKRMMTETESGEFDIDWTKLGTHADIVMSALDNCVHCLDDSSQMSKLLSDLGGRHYRYNVKPEMILYLWPALRDALKKGLGDDEFTMETELAWKHVFDYIHGKMSCGFKIAKSEEKEVRPVRNGLTT